MHTHLYASDAYSRKGFGYLPLNYRIVYISIHFTTLGYTFIQTNTLIRFILRLNQWIILHFTTDKFISIHSDTNNQFHLEKLSICSYYNTKKKCIIILNEESQ